jgi:hypothetical protein
MAVHGFDSRVITLILTRRMEMVLKKDGAQIAKGGFEDEDTPAATATAEAPAAQPTIAEKATADVAATTAVAGSSG